MLLPKVRDNHEDKVLVLKIVSYWQGKKRIEDLTRKDIEEAIKYKK